MSGIIGKVATGSGTHLVTSTFYGTCATAEGTVAKVVKLADTNIDSAPLLTGMTLAVKFTYSNTAANPTLKVQRGGNTTDLISAKSIKQYGTTAPGTTEAASWRAGAIVLFIYDGTNWVMVSSIDNDTAYTHPTTAGNIHIPSGGNTGQLLKYGGSSGTATWTTFTTNTPTAVTPNTVIISTSYDSTTEVLTFNTGASATVTAGTAASFS